MLAVLLFLCVRRKGYAGTKLVKLLMLDCMQWGGWGMLCAEIFANKSVRTPECTKLKLLVYITCSELSYLELRGDLRNSFIVIVGSKLPPETRVCPATTDK